jgi:hypothetical protein
MMMPGPRFEKLEEALMHSLVSMLVDATRQIDVGQAAHAASAYIALHYGRKYPRPMRLALWACSSVVFGAIGAAGFYWGKPGLPLLLTAGPDAHLFRPLPGVIELRTVDHVVQLFLSAVFAGATAIEYVRGLDLRVFPSRVPASVPAPAGGVLEGS